MSSSQTNAATESRELNAEHFKMLVDSGISPEVAKEFAFSDPKGIQFIHKDWSNREVLQLRKDKPKNKHDRYRFPKGSFVPVSVRRWDDNNEHVLFVEGTKQSLAAMHAEAKYNVLGTTGCAGWMNKGNDGPLRPLKGRHVVAVFDKDLTTKRGVWDAAEALQERLKGVGAASLRFVNLSDHAFAAGDTDGLDDVLSRVEESRRSDFIETLVDNAVNDIGNPPMLGVDDFLTPNLEGGLRTDVAVQAVEQYGPFKTDVGYHLWHFTENGVWSPDGYQEASRRLQRIMDGTGKYRDYHAREVTKMLSARSPELTDDNIDSAYINTANGMVEWKTGELTEHTPDVFSPAQVPHTWNPDAKCPQIDAFLHSVMDEETVEFFYELAGYCLLNDYPYHHFFAFYGTGRNGKSVALKLLTTLVGAQNCAATAPQQLDANRFRAAQLHGKLLNAVGDIDPKVFKATEIFKSVTGQDIIDAERKNGHPFSFTNRATMIGAFNELPRTADTTVGFFERWLVVPFTKFVPAEQRDPNLAEKLTARGEMEGFLVKAVEGLQRLNKRGNFQPSTAIREASDSFRITADHVRDMVVNRLEFDPDGFVSAQDLHDEYKRTVLNEGAHPKQKKKFVAELKSAVSEIFNVDESEMSVKRRQGLGFRVKWSSDAEGVESNPDPFA